MSAVLKKIDSHAPGNDLPLAVPPHSIEAESSVLGGLLLDNAAWDRIDGLLTVDDLYRYEHRLIFGAARELLVQAKPADVITVFEHLQKQGKGEEVGGLAYLNSLAQYVPSAGNIRRYAEIVREKAVMRRLAAAGNRIASMPFQPGTTTVAEMVDAAQSEVMALSETAAARRGSENVSVLMGRLLDRLQEVADNPNASRGAMTGLADLDRATNGLQDGDLIVLAARPSMGKTAMALNIAENLALREKLPTLVISLEMTSDQLMTRVTGSVCRIDQMRLRNADLTNDEWARIAESTVLLDGPLEICDGAGMANVSAIRTEARKIARQHGKLGLIVVDYLQMMDASEGGSDENRASRLGEVSRGLKLLAKELNCPVLALSQLNRSVENRTDKRPLMSDLRESGAIEQDADIVMFIYRDDYYTKEACKEPGVAEIIIAKHRNGPTGTVRAAWLPEYTRFENLAH